MKCQACNTVNSDLDDFGIGYICHACGWEHDSNLEFYYQDKNSAQEMSNKVYKSMLTHDSDNGYYIVSFSVGYDLSKLEREGWSTANGDTPNDHYRRWIENDRKIKYKYEM